MKTAVEWMQNTLWKEYEIELPIEVIEKAKQMEKAEKDKQYQRGFKDGSNHIKIIYNL